VSQESTNRSFDELARALAEGSISRRRALKLFAGTALAALIPSRALAITCPPGTVKICHIPKREGTCKRSEAETRCVTPENAARHLTEHPCDCCGGCGGTDKCREPKPRTCFSTSTSTSSTTSTSTSTTSTSTSTSTTTCSGLPNGASCTANNQCCSGNCSNGFCCESGRVGLSNGTCAKPCTSSADCPPGCSGGCVEEFSGAQYCATTERRVEGACTSELPCPTESFCVSGGTECRVAC
jgi:hypothetical protein